VGEAQGRPGCSSPWFLRPEDKQRRIAARCGFKAARLRRARESAAIHGRLAQRADCVILANCF
jgi:hypothetical protein